VATTFTVQDGITFVQSYIKQQSLFVNNQQPALGAAQIVLNVVLGPPFTWRTNRTLANFSISNGGGTDYTQTLASFGRLETQWLTDGSNKTHQLGGELSLPKVSTAKLPTKIAPQYDDNLGHITFRFDSIPDATYTANLDYQQKAPLITGAASPLGTLSDENADLFFEGMLTWASLLVNDARFPIFERQFISHLLSRQDGLSEQAKIIFMGQWMEYVRTAQRSQSMTQGGAQGRQM
jgi:hypothetical protein